MTTLIGVQLEDDVLLGWDGRVTASNEHFTLRQEKFFVTHGIIMGVTGTVRVMNIFSTLDLPEYDGSDALSWTVVNLIPTLEAAAEHFKLTNEDGKLDANLLVVVDSQLFKVGSDFSVYSAEEPIFTMGSGGDYALGALKAGADVLEALTIAASCDHGSGGTLTVTKASEMIKNGS